MEKEIKFVISLSDKIVSINSLYRAAIKYAGNKPVPFIYKTDIAKRMGAQILEAMRAIDWSPHLDWLSETKYFSVTQNYVFKSGFNKRDVENGSKGVSDFIVKFIHDELGIETFDDSKFSDLHLYKSILPGSEHEYLCISLKPSNFNVRYDHNNVPSCAQIRSDKEGYDTKEFKDVMKKKGIKWTGKNNTLYDTFFHFIDSNGKSRLDLLTDILDFIYSYKDGNFIYYGFYRSSDKDIVEKINSFGLSNVRADLIEEDSGVAGFIDKIVKK